jgi:hypothetical protein
MLRGRSRSVVRRRNGCAQLNALSQERRMPSALHLYCISLVQMTRIVSYRMRPRAPVRVSAGASVVGEESCLDRPRVRRPTVDCSAAMTMECA